MYSRTCGVPLPLETKPVERPAARASLKTATAHSLVMRGSLYVLTTAFAPSLTASRTRVSGVAPLRRNDGCRIAERLGGHPVLAVTAVKVAAQHSEAIGKRSGIGVKE